MEDLQSPRTRDPDLPDASGQRRRRRGQEADRGSHIYQGRCPLGTEEGGHETSHRIEVRTRFERRQELSVGREISLRIKDSGIFLPWDVIVSLVLTTPPLSF